MKEIIDKIIRYEKGELSEAETIDLFQRLIDEGLMVQYEGRYGKVAAKLIEEGKITKEPRPKSIRLMDDMFE